MHPPKGSRFISLPRWYRGARRCSLLRRPRAARHKPGHLVRRRALRAGSHSRNAWDLPGSWATLRALAPLLDPGEASRARPLRRGGAADAFRRALAHPNWSFRGSITRLSHSLSTLRGRDRSRSRARLATGWWPAFAGQVCLLLSCSGRFQCHDLLATFSPPPGFAWRDLNDWLEPGSLSVSVLT